MAQFRLPECSLAQSAHFVRQALTAFAMQNPAPESIAHLDWSGWLRRRDSNLCISNSDLLNFTVQTVSWAAGQRLRLFLRVLPAHLQFEMRKCESRLLG
jgi:hypothetical protein